MPKIRFPKGSRVIFEKLVVKFLLCLGLPNENFGNPNLLFFLENLVLWHFWPYTLNFEFEVGRADTLRMVVRQNLAKSGPQYRPVAFMI